MTKLGHHSSVDAENEGGCIDINRRGTEGRSNEPKNLEMLTRLENNDKIPNNIRNIRIQEISYDMKIQLQLPIVVFADDPG